MNMICKFHIDGMCYCTSRAISENTSTPMPCIVAPAGSRGLKALWGTDQCKYFSNTGDAPACAPVESLEKNVNHPSRYTRGKVECIDALESAVVGKPPDEAIHVANVIKYLWRYEEKEPLRSLMSAEWYLKRLIDKVKAKTGN